MYKYIITCDGMYSLLYKANRTMKENKSKKENKFDID